MSEQWHYTQAGKQLGPVSATGLKQLATSGQLLPTDLVWKEGIPNWIPCGQLKGLFPTPTTSAPPPLPSAPPPLPPISSIPQGHVPPPKAAPLANRLKCLGISLIIAAGILALTAFIIILLSLGTSESKNLWTSSCPPGEEERRARTIAVFVGLSAIPMAVFIIYGASRMLTGTSYACSMAAAICGIVVGVLTIPLAGTGIFLLIIGIRTLVLLRKPAIKQHFGGSAQSLSP